MSADRPISLQTAAGGVPQTLPLTAGLLPLFLLLPTLLYPLARDQWTFAYMGRALLMGETLYRDAWDVKPPPIYLIYSLILVVSGLEPEQVRIGVLVAALMPACAAGFLLARLAVRWIGHWAGLPAAALWTLLYLHGGRGGRLIESAWGIGQAETWAMPLVLGALLLASERPTLPRLGGAAALMALAVWIKWPLAIFIVPFLAVLWRSISASAAWKSLLTLLLLIAVPVSFSFWREWWQAFQEIQLDWVAHYAALGVDDPSAGVARHARSWLNWLAAAAAPTIAAAMVLIPRRFCEGNRAAVGHAFILFGAGVAVVVAQGKYFGYHWQAAAPGLTLVALCGADRVREWAAQGRWPAWLAPGRFLGASSPVAWLLVLAYFLTSVSPIYNHSAARAVGLISRADWLPQFGVPGKGDYSPAATDEAGRRLAETATGGGLLVWGFEPALYFYTGETPRTRFFFNTALTAPFCPASWRREFLADLAADPPRRIVLMSNDAVPYAGGTSADSAAYARRWAELNNFLAERYQQAWQSEHFRVLELLRSPAETAKSLSP